MRGAKAAKVLVVEDFEKYAVGVPGGAGADEFAVGSSQRVKDGVVEFLIVSDKIHLVTVRD